MSAHLSGCDQCGGPINGEQYCGDCMAYAAARIVSLEVQLQQVQADYGDLDHEVARLKTMHCPECGNDVFTRRDTGGQQCLECGTAIGPFIAAAEERGAKMYAKFIADFYAITGADTEWFDRWLAARAALADKEVPK